MSPLHRQNREATTTQSLLGEVASAHEIFWDGHGDLQEEVCVYPVLLALLVAEGVSCRVQEAPLFATEEFQGRGRVQVQDGRGGSRIKNSWPANLKEGAPPIASSTTGVSLASAIGQRQGAGAGAAASVWSGADAPNLPGGIAKGMVYFLRRYCRGHWFQPSRMPCWIAEGPL